MFALPRFTADGTHPPQPQATTKWKLRLITEVIFMIMFNFLSKRCTFIIPLFPEMLINIHGWASILRSSNCWSQTIWPILLKPHLLGLLSFRNHVALDVEAAWQLFLTHCLQLNWKSWKQCYFKRHQPTHLHAYSIQITWTIHIISAWIWATS